MEIALRVVGGIAAMDYSIRLDGGTGEVVGERCRHLCDFRTGEILAVVSDHQVTRLANDLEAAGVLERPFRDFGSSCCDMIGYELEYRRGARQSTIVGSDLPPDLHAAVGRLVNYAQGIVPVVVDFGTSPPDWPRDPFTWTSATLNGYLLDATLSYSGGCRGHPVDLVVWGGWKGTTPTEVDAFVAHDDRDDPCDSVVTRTVRFDLIALRTAWQRDFGVGPGQPGHIVLRIADRQAPGGVRRLDFAF